MPTAVDGTHRILIDFSELPHDGLTVTVDADDHADHHDDPPRPGVRQPRGTTKRPREGDAMTATTALRRTFGAAAVVAVLGSSACSAGGSGDGVASAGGERDVASPSETEDTAPLDEDAQALVFAECMRDNGIAMPDPGPGQRGLGEAFQREEVQDEDRETLQQAIATCRALMPQFEQEEHGDDVMLELADCLREQGLDVSDDPFSDMHGGEFDREELTAATESAATG